jgi:hypothetical protein
LQPILPGGEPKQISFLYIRHLKIAETHAVLYFGRAGLKPALFCRKRQRQRQRRAGRWRPAGFFRAIDNAAFQLRRQGGDRMRSISTPTGPAETTASALRSQWLMLPYHGAGHSGWRWSPWRGLFFTDLPQGVNRGDTPGKMLGLPLAGAAA